MALKTFILENSSVKRQRQTDIQNAVREYLGNKKLKVVYDEQDKPSIEGFDKKIHISVTRANKVMLVVLYDKPIGIDGEYLPRILAPENKIDYIMLAEKFFSVEESEYLRDSAKEDEKLNFVKLWVRKEAYVKAAGKTVAEFPNFSVVDGSRMLPKVNGVSLKNFSIKFPECEDYFFVIAGIE